MILVLVRHAPAEDLTEETNDHERRLTASGRKKKEKAAAGLAVMLLREKGFCIAAVRSSDRWKQRNCRRIP